MTKLTILSLSLCVLTLGNLAHALPLLDGPPPPARHAPDSGRAACTDFSGSWKGTCTQPSAPPYEITEKLTQQGCDTLLTEHGFYPLGGMKTEGYSMADGTAVNYASSITWNKEKTVLSVQHLGLVHFANGMSPAQIAGDISVAGNAMKITAKGQNHENIMECNLQRL